MLSEEDGSVKLKNQTKDQPDGRGTKKEIEVSNVTQKVATVRDGRLEAGKEGQVEGKADRIQIENKRIEEKDYVVTGTERIEGQVLRQRKRSKKRLFDSYGVMKHSAS